MPHVRLASALRAALAAGYDRASLRADVLAGLVVGVVALPLSMALAIATGVPPQHGLFTAIVAGATVAALGGSRCQVSGPTAAFVVILVPIVERHGLGGLMLATAMAGVLLMGMGLAGLGRLLAFVPYPVTTGFTAGIGVVIASLQARDLALLSPTDWGLAAVTLGLLLGWPRISRGVPAPLVALTVAAVVGVVLTRWLDLPVATIATRFAEQDGIPRALPTFAAPWTVAGPDGRSIGLSLEMLRELASPAFAIAVLGAIESLLSAVVADGLAGTTHDPDGELFAQGVGNLVAPFFGGFAATGAIARTATNVRAGGRSPVAALVHAGFLLVAMFALAPLLGYLPMAALAALLLLVAWNMAELPHVVHALRHSPRSDAAVLLTCFLATVVFDMVVAVVAGVTLASLLFMRRMAEVSDVRLVNPTSPDDLDSLPPGVLHYALAGPLFFGAAQKAMQQLHVVGDAHWAVVVDLTAVPTIDATGLVNLESVIRRLARENVMLVLAGVSPHVRGVLERAGMLKWGHVAPASNLGEAAALLRDCAPAG